MTKMAHVPAHRTDFFFHKKKQQFCAMVFESLETKNGVLVLHGNMKKSDVTGVFFHFFLFRSSVKVKVAEKCFLRFVKLCLKHFRHATMKNNNAKFGISTLKKNMNNHAKFGF